MIENKLIQRAFNWILFGTILFSIASCSINKNYIGHYKDTTIKGASCFRTITLNKDSTASITWWTDIRMTNKGSWSISKNTIVFIDSSYRKMNKTFIIENKKLINIANGRIYKKAKRNKKP